MRRYSSAAVHGFIIAEEPARSDDVRWCFEQYYAELEQRLEGGFDDAAAVPLGLDDLSPPRGLVLVARLGGAPVGCGAVKLGDPHVAEVKRLWVVPEARGRGLGGRLLAELEMRAIGAGKVAVRLDSNRSLTEAMGLYRSRGYRGVEPFNDERYADQWYEKALEATVLPAPGGLPSGQRRRERMNAQAPVVHDLREPVSTPADGIVSRTIHNDDDVRVVLFSFAAGQQLSDHTAAVPVTIEVVDGEAEIGVGSEQIEGRPGTWLHLAAETPHSVHARTPLTVLLTMLKRHG